MSPYATHTINCPACGVSLKIQIYEIDTLTHDASMNYLSQHINRRGETMDDCPREMFTIYQILHTILSLFGVLINLFLLFLAVNKSPKIMRPCSALITNKALTDIMSSLANFFVMQQFVVLESGAVGIVPHGPCTLFGNTACYAGHMLMMSFLEHNLIWLIACYLFRYYILYVCDPKIKSIIFVAIMVYTPSLAHIGLWVRAYSQQKVELQTANFTVPNLLEGPIILWSSLVVFCQLVVTAILVVVCYLWIRNVLLNFLISMGIQMSAECKILNQQLVKILTFQVCIPFWIMLAIFIWTVQYTWLPTVPFLGNCVTISFMLAPVISPFSYIIFVPHYWDFCTGKKIEKEDFSTMNGTVTNVDSARSE